MCPSLKESIYISIKEYDTEFLTEWCVCMFTNVSLNN